VRSGLVMKRREVQDAELLEFAGRLRRPAKTWALPFGAGGLVVLAVSAWPTTGSSAPTVNSAAHAVLRPSAAVVPQLPAAAPAPASVAPTEAALPERWLPARGRECARSGKYRGFCQGPRRVPAPHGPAAELAEQLGLGTTKAVSVLLLEAPKPEWVAAAGEADARAPLYPVAEGMVWRGLQRARGSSGRPGRIKHKGVDIGAPQGSAIRAVQSGIVAYADNGVRGYGNLLVTVHPDGTSALYAHCRSIYVFPGQRIARGQRIAEVGQTGIARGPHLHFEYRNAGRIRDPLALFEPPPGS
jgi:hypothetical protein